MDPFLDLTSSAAGAAAAGAGAGSMLERFLIAWSLTAESRGQKWPGSVLGKNRPQHKQ